MYSNGGPGHQPHMASGQQSAFSHPPHFITSAAASPNGMVPSRAYGAPSGYYGSPASASQHAFMARHGSGGVSHWSSPHAGSSTAGADAIDEDDEEDEEDEDDDEEGDAEDDEEDDDDDQDSGKKRKRADDKKDAKARGGKAGGKKAKEEATANDGTKKPKPTRGAKACVNCRRLKMRCVGAENGPPCNRCKNTNHECIFAESNRGKKSGKFQRSEAMAASLRKMEATMNTLIQSLRDPSRAFSASAGIVTRSPTPELYAQHKEHNTRHMSDRAPWTSQHEDRERLRRGWHANDEADELGRVFPSNANANLDNANEAAGGISNESVAQGMHVGQSLRGMMGSGAGQIDPATLASRSQPDLITSSTSGTSTERQVKGARFVEPDVPPRKQRATSPRLHSLPDNTLNPLGLLAEASLHNHHRSRRLSRNRGQSEDPIRTALRAAAEANSTASPTSPDSVSKGTAANQSPAGAKVDSEPGSTPSKQGPINAATVGSTTSEARSTSAKSEGAKDKPTPKVGVASETYFKPGPMTILPLRKIVIDRELAPELLTHGILSSEEVLELFRVFFHHCAQHVVLFDPDWHTPTMICGRSPFLFTVICTIASKFYTKRPELHMQCLEVVRKCAYVIMSRGFKSVEIVQGFLLLSLWQTPAQRFEEDKTWLFSGVAIRMATDLNLHRKSMATLPGTFDSADPAVLEREREILNRERTWLLCFCVDRSMSGQMGKPWTIREDWIIRNSRHWGLQRLSKPYDLGLSALVELLRIMSRQFDFLFSSTTTVSGLNTEIDYSSTLRIFNEQLQEWYDLWQARGFFSTTYRKGKEIDISLQPSSDQERELARKLRSAEVLDEPPAEDVDYDRRTIYFITKQAPLRFNYAVLLLNSLGLQHSVDFPKRSGMDKGIYLSKCLQSAKNIVFAVRDGMRPVLPYAPDSHFIIISYACVFLLKLTRPIFSTFVDEEEIINIVTECADLLDEVAMDTSHTPALYAAFLRALLQSRQDRSTRSGATTPYRSRGASPVASGAEGDAQTMQGEGGASALNDGLGHESAAAAFAATALGNASANSSAPPSRAGLTAEQAAMLGNEGLFGSAGLHGEHIDQLLNESFWSTLLPPGFGGPLDSLANGTVEMYPTMPEPGATLNLGGGGDSGGLTGEKAPEPHGLNNGTGTGTAPGAGGPSTQQTRANTPVMVSTFGPGVSFDFTSSGV